MTTETVAATAGGVVGLRASLINIEGAAVEVMAIELSDRLIGFGGVAHLDETETAGLPGVTIGDEADAGHGAVTFEQRSNRILGGAEAKVSYKDIFQLVFLLSCRGVGQDRTRVVRPDETKKPKQRTDN